MKRAKGLRQFLDPLQQRDWMEGETDLPEQPHGRHAGVQGGTAADERSESLEQRFKYAARFEKLLRRRQAARPRQCELNGAFHAPARRLS